MRRGGGVGGEPDNVVRGVGRWGEWVREWGGGKEGVGEGRKGVRRDGEIK